MSRLKVAEAALAGKTQEELLRALRILGL